MGKLTNLSDAFYEKKIWRFFFDQHLQQVVEAPSCLRGRTKLREGDMTTYSCVVRLKGELSGEAKILWNKKEQILTEAKRLTSVAGVTMISSELKYR